MVLKPGLKLLKSYEMGYGQLMQGNDYAFGPFVFNPQQKSLLKHGSPIAIGQRCAVLLETLLAANGQVVTKSRLMDAAWQTQNVEESNLAVQIAALRKCLGRSKSGSEWIATIQRVGYQFVDPGQETENIDYSSPRVATDDGGRPSIAVLPFVNFNSDPEQSYFGEAVSGDIISELARWRLLSVRSRGASFRFHDETIDSNRVARELNVQYVVEGSVRRIGEKLRIAVQLIDAQTGNQIWAERFEHDASEIFVVQDEVVRSIVGTLVGRVEVAASERASRKPPSSLAAYECVLRGNAMSWNDPSGAREATRLFAHAIELDPHYGIAHAMLGIMHSREWHDNWNLSDDMLSGAYALAKRAVELDGSESTNFAMLSHICSLRRSYDLALQHAQRAIEINPNNQWNIADRGIVLYRVGQPEEAIRSFRSARAIDPYFDPPWHWSGYGVALMMLKQFEESRSCFERISRPSYWPLALLAGCCAMMGDHDAASYAARECLSSRPDFSVRGRFSREQFKNQSDVAYLAECLRSANLPD